MTGTPEPIRAAGCVLWRRSALSGSLEICVIHRPKYDDWSHPKGKLEPDEAPLAAALREVREETGHTCTPGPSLPTAHYQTGSRQKQVMYWAAESTGGHFTPNREVDRIRWLPPSEARSRLSHPQDRGLVDALLKALHPEEKA